MLTLNPDRTTLILIDLQNGIVGMDLAPRTGPQVVETARNPAARFREAGAPVFLVHVVWAPDGADMPSDQVDKPLGARMGDMPTEWSGLVPVLREDGDMVIQKRHWARSPARHRGYGAGAGLACPRDIDTANYD